MYSLPILLATITIILGVSLLTSGVMARLPLWLRLFDIIVGVGMTLYSLWALFLVDSTVKVLYPTLLYFIPFMAIVFSVLYNYGRISWGIKDFEQTLKVQKTKKPKKTRFRDKEQKVLEEVIAEEAAKPVKKETKEVITEVKEETAEKQPETVKKIYVKDDGKEKEFKLPELF